MTNENQITTEIYGMVRRAILGKDVIVARYQGYVREMCPHVVGKKNGQLQAFLYQFAGGSSGGLKPDGSTANWRCLRIDELSDVSTRKSSGKWHTAPNYSPKQTCVDEIDVKVDID
jgi:hypothetical protein